MNQDKRILILLVILLFSLFGVFAIAQEQITLTTYYPAPFGEYENLRFFPTTTVPPCDAAHEGVTFYDNNAPMNILRYCDGTAWQDLTGGGGLWERDIPNQETNLTNVGDQVGIGTADPICKLDIVDPNPVMKIGTIGGGGGTIWFGNGNHGIRRGRTINPPDGNYVEIFTAGDVESGFAFYHSWAGQEFMSINRQGNVGIGVTNPYARLELSDKSWIKLNALDSAGAPDIAGINFDEWGNGTATNVQYGASIRYNEDNDKLEFVTKQNWGDRYGIAIDRSTGNVGIGTNNPQARLDVEVASGPAATIGHSSNSATGNFSIAMGRLATASGAYSTVSGGIWNTASGNYSTVPGGDDNEASNTWSTASGGYDSTASGGASTVSGGYLNTASGERSTVPGGRSNLAQGNDSFAAGAWSRALHNSCFVWSDDQGLASWHDSTAANQFRVRAAGGVFLNAMRTYLQAIDGAGNHWIMVPGVTEGLHNALGFRWPARQINSGPGWTKNFLIHHPLDPENKYLSHSTLEGPEVAVFYRGESHLVNGQAPVKLPDYFEALTRKEGRTVLLTPKFERDEPISFLAASEVREGRFFVKAIDDKNPSQEFYWEVKAVRADVEPLIVETEKNDTE